jgi:hypothetical protein
MSGKKIALLIHNNAHLFSNGITQNIFFMYECFTKLGYMCDFVCIESNPSPFQFRNIPVKQFSTYKDIWNPEEYFLFIYGTRRLYKDAFLYLKSFSIKVIQFVCGNHFMQDSEDFISRDLENEQNGTMKDKPNADEFWIIPSHSFMTEYLEIMRQMRGFTVPHLWSPMLLEETFERKFKKPPTDMIYNYSRHFGKQIDIYILEPNIGIVKTAWLPIIICEKLHRLHPELIQAVNVYNFPVNVCASEMIADFSLGEKIQKCPRIGLDELFHSISTKTTIPIFLTHHFKNSLNYLYYELLYFGYPLVHNSIDLESCGYFYPDNNITEGVQAIVKAFNYHNKQANTYREKSLDYLKRVDPYNADVGVLWKQMIHS